MNKQSALFTAKHRTDTAFDSGVQRWGFRSEQFIPFWNSCSVSPKGFSVQVPKPLQTKLLELSGEIAQIMSEPVVNNVN